MVGAWVTTFKNTILKLRSSYYCNVIRIMKEANRGRGKGGIYLCVGVH